MKIIYCQNYLEHAKEMGKSITKEPIFFLKPDSSLIAKKQPFLPDFSDIHYEVELVYKIKKLVKVLTCFFKRLLRQGWSWYWFHSKDLQAKCKQMDIHGNSQILTNLL